MKKINDILGYSSKEGIERWTLDTTKSKLIGYEKNEALAKELEDNKARKHYVDKYGLMFLYPEDYVSIYIIISLLKIFRILCHPDEQTPNSTIDKLNLKYNHVKWHYDEEIHHDKEFKCRIESKLFYEVPFKDYKNNQGLIKMAWDLATKENQSSRIYELTNSYQIHQAVICGANYDLDKCPNYFGIKSEEQKQSIIKILSQDEKPTLIQLLENCQFFIADYKGEDIGYARQLIFYTIKNEINEKFKNAIENFNNFQIDLKDLNMNCKNLEDYSEKLYELEKRYGS